jgi:nifR3 family TIM-barrel protein
VGFFIGEIPIERPALLAPMEDVTNLPFRLICKRIANPGLMFSEFVSAMALHYGAHKGFLKLRIHPEERPLGIQIFGGEPEVMAQAARLAEEAGADLVDINMGCWVPKVCRTGSGAALLKDPDLAEKIVRAVGKAVEIPVTVKVRAGWDYSMFAAPDLAKRFQDAGVKMITLHARFAKQGFEGKANWELISQLREVLEIPLIGNGDIKSAADARRMMEQTGCDGVMVGRAAIGNPWQLREIVYGIAGKQAPSPSLQERVDVAIEHVRLARDYYDYEPLFVKSNLDPETFAVRSLRGQLPLYIKGVSGASQIRARLSQCDSIQEVEEVLYGFLDAVTAKAENATDSAFVA